MQSESGVCGSVAGASVPLARLAPRNLGLTSYLDVRSSDSPLVVAERQDGVGGRRVANKEQTVHGSLIKQDLLSSFARNGAEVVARVFAHHYSGRRFVTNALLIQHVFALQEVEADVGTEFKHKQRWSLATATSTRLLQKFACVFAREATSETASPQQTFLSREQSRNCSSSGTRTTRSVICSLFPRMFLPFSVDALLPLDPRSALATRDSRRLPAPAPLLETRRRPRVA